MTSIDIIIPVRNEEHTIKDIIERCKHHGNVTIIDGNSTDNTLLIAKSLGVKILTDDRKGKGSAIRLGIEESEADILVFIDGDGSHIPEDIPQLIAPIVNNEVDAVLTSRSLGGSEELSGQDLGKFIRVTGSAAITLLINWRFGKNLSDSQNGYRSIKRSVALDLKLKENSFAIESEMLMKALKKGYSVTEIPSKELKRKYGESNINLWRDAYKYVFCVLRNII